MKLLTFVNDGDLDTICTAVGHGDQLDTDVDFEGLTPGGSPVATDMAYLPADAPEFQRLRLAFCSAKLGGLIVEFSRADCVRLREILDMALLPLDDPTSESEAAG